MAISIFLAKLIGLYLVIVPLLYIFSPERFKRSIRILVADEGSLVVSGLVALTLGLAILVGHPVVEWSWRTLITAMGFLLIAKGAARFLYPDKVRETALKIIGGDRFINVMFFSLILGLLFLYLGFIKGF